MPLQGAIAAALTPLREGRLDRDAVPPYVEFLAAGGLDGALAMGTTGEGMLFVLDERKEIADAFADAARGRLQLAVHAGMQSTADTVALAEHAASIGADAVAVIPPPYFALDDDALFAHLAAAAHACAPVPFYVYEFEKTAGYAVSRDVLERLREAAPNLAGMKVSDTPWEAFARYLDVGLDVFVGPEGFIGRGLERGAVGAVSALGSAFPERLATAVRAKSDELAELRQTIERFPRHAALKHVVRRRGVPIQEDVRAPLRALTADEARALDDATS
jgi:dihydrodipicolinate synthase/N-acetylneuraminate lyase